MTDESLFRIDVKVAIGTWHWHGQIETKHMAAVTISPYKTCYAGGWPKTISR
jgi:hypothetical protein